MSDQLLLDRPNSHRRIRPEDEDGNTTLFYRNLAHNFWCERASSPEERQAVRQAECMSAQGDLVDWWDWKFDLTFLDDPRTGTCRVSAPRVDSLVRAWARRVAQHWDQHALVLYALAKSDLNHRPHVHGVLSFRPFSGLKAPEVAEESWCGYPCGRAVVESYDLDKGGVHYVLTHGHVNARVACPRRPRCRKHPKACAVALGSWVPSEAEFSRGRLVNRGLRNKF